MLEANATPEDLARQERIRHLEALLEESHKRDLASADDAIAAASNLKQTLGTRRIKASSKRLLRLNGYANGVNGSLNGVNKLNGTNGTHETLDRCVCSTVCS